MVRSRSCCISIRYAPNGSFPSTFCSIVINMRSTIRFFRSRSVRGHAMGIAQLLRLLFYSSRRVKVSSSKSYMIFPKVISHGSFTNSVDRLLTIVFRLKIDGQIDNTITGSGLATYSSPDSSWSPHMIRLGNTLSNVESYFRIYQNSYGISFTVHGKPLARNLIIS